jgi:hypothetical protein
MRGAWIRQHRTATFVTDPAATPSGFASIYQNWVSWAVGPRGSLNTQWQLGQGFRLYGIGAADLLYTRYTNIREIASVVSTSGTLLSNIGVKQILSMLRAHLEMEIGLGWNTYLDCNRRHIDIAAGYKFNEFLHQRLFLSSVTT